MINFKFQKLTQDQLDLFATLFGAIAGIAELLVATQRIGNEDGQLIAGLAMIAWGVVSNKKPSSSSRLIANDRPNSSAN